MSALTAIDLFAGAGGATEGLREAGFSVIGAIEFDADAASSYRLNHPDVELWEQDIRGVKASAVRSKLGLAIGELTLLKACPPCQGFSTLAEGRLGDAEDPRNDLVGHTTRFVRALQPKTVLIENVPGLGRDRRATELLSSLRSMSYAARSYIVNASDFGVPQRRRRYIIVAIKGLRSKLPQQLMPSDLVRPTTVRDAFRELESKVLVSDPLHAPKLHSALVQERIAAIPVGGTRFDLPERLQLECHKNLGADGSRGASGSYGRMKWDTLAPTMTTRCTTPSSGSFIHPELDRAITLREAAAIQTFPVGYKFFGTHGAVERQIGNAVPVRMATGIARTLLSAIGHGS